MQTSGVRVAGRRPWRIVVAAMATGVVLLSAGCSAGHRSSGPGGSGGGADSSGSPSPEPAASTVAVTQPAAGAKDVVASTEIKYST
jgi:hypothetical protein